MATVADHDDYEMPRGPRDAVGFLIVIAGILCYLLGVIGTLVWPEPFRRRFRGKKAWGSTVPNKGK